jgi:KTSC domain-containing protein
MPVLDSEALLAVHYDAKRRRLRATFRESRRTYEYDGVTEAEYAALLAAPSRGAWFNQHIKPRHPCRQVGRSNPPPIIDGQ